MKRLLVWALLVGLLCASVVFGEVIVNTIMMTGRASADQVIDLTTETRSYILIAINDTVNFAFYDKDSVYVTEMTLLDGEIFNGITAKSKTPIARYISVNAPDVSNTISVKAFR